MTTNTHTRACPICDKIIPWTFGEPQGKHKARPAKLICPEHGEFEPISDDTRNKINSALVDALFDSKKWGC